MAYRIALVEDDPLLRENYLDSFTRQGYLAEGYPDRIKAQAAFSERLPDLAVIDIGLGDEIDGGFALCQWLRSQSASLPIIFLSARDSDFDIVSGLRMGADDYLTKDISLPHLLARIAALFRRIEVHSNDTGDDGGQRIDVGDLALDGDRFTCSWRNEPIDLTLTEFWMLWSLTRRAGHVKSRQQLMDDSEQVVDDGTITSHIKRIRKKFLAVDADFDHIETVYGMGYRWNAN